MALQHFPDLSPTQTGEESDGVSYVWCYSRRPPLEKMKKLTIMLRLNSTGHSQDIMLLHSIL